MSLLSDDKWVQYPFMMAMEKMGIMATSCSIHKVTAMAIETRLHSSRMHTARLLSVSPSMHCSRGCLLPLSVHSLGGVCSKGGVCSRGRVCSQEDVCIPACTEADTWVKHTSPHKCSILCFGVKHSILVKISNKVPRLWFTKVFSLKDQ